MTKTVRFLLNFPQVQCQYYFYADIQRGEETQKKRGGGGERVRGRRLMWRRGRGGRKTEEVAKANSFLSLSSPSPSNGLLVEFFFFFTHSKGVAGKVAGWKERKEKRRGRGNGKEVGRGFYRHKWKKKERGGKTQMGSDSATVSRHGKKEMRGFPPGCKG